MKNKFTEKQFLEEFSDFLTSASTQENVLITGDFNIHVDDTTQKLTTDFVSILSNLGFDQHISGSTHRAGHTLDLLITSKLGPVPKDISSHDLCISDHFALKFQIDFTKPKSDSKVLSYRDRKNVNFSSLKQDILSLSFHENQNIKQCVTSYNESINSICDIHLPMTTRRIIIRPNRKWYGQLLRAQRTKRRRLERKKNKTGLQEDKNRYLSQCIYYNHLCNEAKTQFLSQSILDSSNDKRKLFSVAKDILNWRDRTILPVDNYNLTDRFADFFVDKIVKIQSNISTKQESIADLNQLRSEIAQFLPQNRLTSFEPTNFEEICAIIKIMLRYL